MSRIIFILNNVADTRSHKRIREFIDHGYEVKVYGCQRTGIAFNQQYPYEVNVFGNFGQNHYLKRLGILLKAIRQILHENQEDDIYYCFGMDNALAVYLQTRRRYIYEEADLSHTYIGKKVIIGILEWLDKEVIKHSLLTAFTSDGYLEYHFGGKHPANSAMIYNKLPPTILDIPILPKRKLDMKNLKIGFVGGIRGVTVCNFAKVIGEHFPQHEVHFYGYVNKVQEDIFAQLKAYPNIFFHGAFTSPVDLPKIYSQIDMIFATYDAFYENVRYAEPNKLYEAIYFETPFVVSSHTFLAEKVKRLGIGFDVDALDDEAVCAFFQQLTEQQMEEKKNNAAHIDKKYTINENSAFFEKLKRLVR